MPVPFVSGVGLGLRTGEIFLHYEILVSSTNSISRGCIAGARACLRVAVLGRNWVLPSTHTHRVGRSNFMLVLFCVAGVMVTCESTNWPV